MVENEIERLNTEEFWKMKNNIDHLLSEREVMPQYRNFLKRMIKGNETDPEHVEMAIEEFIGDIQKWEVRSLLLQKLDD